MRGLPNYHFHSFGAGGSNGKVRLYQYNWGQVSAVRIPYFLTSECGFAAGDNVDFKKKPTEGINYYESQCRRSQEYPSSGFNDEGMQKQFELDVRTLRSIMNELGHTHVDVLKLDVEGSEFAFLESAIGDFDCPPVEQFSVEWHHYKFDMRYGGGSSPEINAISTYLHDRCDTKVYQLDYEDGGFVDSVKWAVDAGMNMRYNTASYIRTRKYS